MVAPLFLLAFAEYFTIREIMGGNLVWSPHIIRWGVTSATRTRRCASRTCRGLFQPKNGLAWREIRRQAFTRSAAFNQVDAQREWSTWCPPAPDPRYIGNDPITVTRHGYSKMGIKGTGRDIGYSSKPIELPPTLRW